MYLLFYGTINDELPIIERICHDEQNIDNLNNTLINEK